MDDQICHLALESCEYCIRAYKLYPRFTEFTYDLPVLLFTTWLNILYFGTGAASHIGIFCPGILYLEVPPVFLDYSSQLNRPV